MLRAKVVLNGAGWFFMAVLLGMLLFNLFRQNTYDKKIGINLLYQAKDGMGIVIVRPEGGLVSLTRLPDNLILNVDPTGAEYQVSAFYKIGLPLKDSLNASRISVGQSLGVALTGVVKANNVFSLAGLREALYAVPTHTNLSVIDRYLLIKDIGEMMKRNTILTLSLPSKVMDREEEPDGKEVLRLNSAIFVWTRVQWVADEILSETTEVSVANASGREGKARMVARQMETAGVRVIDLLSAKKEIEAACLVIGDVKKHPLTMSFLKTAFGCVTSSLKVGEFLESDVKSDLVVVLGKRS